MPGFVAGEQHPNPRSRLRKERNPKQHRRHDPVAAQLPLQRQNLLQFAGHVLVGPVRAEPDRPVQTEPEPDGGLPCGCRHHRLGDWPNAVTARFSKCKWTPSRNHAAACRYQRHQRGDGLAAAMCAKINAASVPAILTWPSSAAAGIPINSSNGPTARQPKTTVITHAPFHDPIPSEGRRCDTSCVPSSFALLLV